MQRITRFTSLLLAVALGTALLAACASGGGSASSAATSGGSGITVYGVVDAGVGKTSR